MRGEYLACCERNPTTDLDPTSHSYAGRKRQRSTRGHCRTEVRGNRTWQSFQVGVAELPLWVPKQCCLNLPFVPFCRNTLRAGIDSNLDASSRAQTSGTRTFYGFESVDLPFLVDVPPDEPGLGRAGRPGYPSEVQADRHGIGGVRGPLSPGGFVTPSIERVLAVSPASSGAASRSHRVVSRTHQRPQIYGEPGNTWVAKRWILLPGCPNL